MHKCLTALSDACPLGVALAFDCSNAFKSTPRSKVLYSVSRRAPRLFQNAPSSPHWLTGATQHYWRGDPAEGAHRIRAKGVWSARG